MYNRVNIQFSLGILPYIKLQYIFKVVISCLFVYMSSHLNPLTNLSQI